jgi:ribulose-phosphate 3-epimerase
LSPWAFLRILELMNTKIIPALMPESFQDIHAHAALVRNHIRYMQIDIMDGNYVPEKTWPFFYKNDYDFEDLQREEKSLPFWEDLDYEFDLMIERPEKNLNEWFALGASRLVFHMASIHDWEIMENIDPVVRNFTKIGLALRTDDDIERACSFLDNGMFDYVQVMGILHIGYQGEPFLEEALDLIDFLRKKYPELQITVDGGVSEETIVDLMNAGANEFISGSAVFGGGDALENIRNLSSLIDY